jgi:hypothetical protein
VRNHPESCESERRIARDPDGNLVNLFTPVTEEAVKKFSS